MENLLKLYEDFYAFAEEKNFHKEFKALVDSRPMLSIHKNAEYSMLVRDLLFEYLTRENQTKVTPEIIGFILNLCIDTYPELEVTLKECYR